MRDESSMLFISFCLLLASLYLLGYSLLFLFELQLDDVFKFIRFNASTIIAILALIGTFSQAWSAQVLNANSVRPFIIIGIEQIGSVLSLTIKNVGNGPAIFKRFEILQQGIILKHGDVRNQISKYFYPAYVYEYFTFLEESGLGAGEEVVVIKIADLDEDHIDENMKTFTKEFNFEMEYTSLYGKTFYSRK